MSQESILRLCKEAGVKIDLEKKDQHFMINSSVLNKIANQAKLTKKDNVIEIGPGFGFLTEKIAKKAGEICAIEIDKQFKPFLELTEEDWDKVLSVNLKGYFLCSQVCAKEMVKQKSGAIVNIASIGMGGAGVGFPTIAHYCASKGGIVAMTEALALELAPYNIRVNAIAPGAIDTPMSSSTKDDPKALEGTLARIPMRRMGKPEEISNAVLFLASDQSSYMTGSVVVVDGGWLST